MCTTNQNHVSLQSKIVMECFIMWCYFSARFRHARGGRQAGRERAARGGHRVDGPGRARRPGRPDAGGQGPATISTIYFRNTTTLLLLPSLLFKSEFLKTSTFYFCLLRNFCYCVLFDIFLILHCKDYRWFVKLFVYSKFCC